MNIKVCGITTVEQMEQLQAAEVDYAGMIFYEGSKRYAHDKLKSDKADIRTLAIKKVGVFVNADMSFLKSCIVDYGLNAVQLHGDERPDVCRLLQKSAVVIKVFRIGEEATKIDDLVAPYVEASDFFLFDTDTSAYGGSGKRFDWNLLEQAAINKPFFLSGGIGPDDAERVMQFRHSFLHAVDINSRFEQSAGLKDMDLVKSFVNTFKQRLYG